MTFYNYGRQEVALLALTSLLPVFIIGIRWASYFGDTSKLGIALATFMFHVVHALFLVACIWVALDPPFSPRNKGFGSPFLTFYYLGALSVGYCSGYFLLLFSGKTDRPRRIPSHLRLINKAVTGAIWLLLLLAPVGADLQKPAPDPHDQWPHAQALRCVDGTSRFHPNASSCSRDDPRRSLLLQAYAAQSGKGRITCSWTRPRWYGLIITGS